MPFVSFFGAWMDGRKLVTSIDRSDIGLTHVKHVKFATWSSWFSRQLCKLFTSAVYNHISSNDSFPSPNKRRLVKISSTTQLFILICIIAVAQLWTLSENLVLDSTWKLERLHTTVEKIEVPSPTSERRGPHVFNCRSPVWYHISQICTLVVAVRVISNSM